MKKAIACLLALPLALAACGVQNVPAQTTQPTDTPVETPAPTTASHCAGRGTRGTRLNQRPKYTGARRTDACGP